MSRGPRVPAGRSFVELVFARQRATLAVVLVGVPLACWLWVIALTRDMYGTMSGPAAWMMTASWDAAYLLLLWAMWAAMMTAMMLPSAAPFVLLYARASRQRSEPDADALPVYALAGGYLLVWGAFSVGATLLQLALAGSGWLTPMMEAASPLAAGVPLLLAGLYQFTPLKQACLRSCRAPLPFMRTRWRRGAGGALRMGAEHGAYCLGCCWALMLLLFAGGVMNLFVVLALTVWVAVEKLAPFGALSSRLIGALLVSAGLWVSLR